MKMREILQDAMAENIAEVAKLFSTESSEPLWSFV
jgi:hypothetical protein